MIIDSRSLPENETIVADVCIVGAGVAGITLAREFIGQQFHVCLLESGGFEPDNATQSLYEGENAGHPYYALHEARARYLGGSSNRWGIDIGDNRLGVRLRPFDEIDFEERDWIANSGWPFNKSHIEPFYKRAESICQVEPYTYRLDDWEEPQKNRLPFIGDKVKTIIYKFGSKEAFTNDYPREIGRAYNVATYLYANVLEVETDEEAKKVTRLRVSCLDGKKFGVSAKLYILAIGGIETPRLLLLSNKSQTCGLGNQNDLVGRFFMEHLHFWSGVYVPSNRDIFRSTGLYDGIHAVNNVPIIGKLALAEKVLRRERLLNQNIQLIPRVVSLAFLRRRVRATAAGGIASKTYEAVKRRLATLYARPISLG